MIYFEKMNKNLLRGLKAYDILSKEIKYTHYPIVLGGAIPFIVPMANEDGGGKNQEVRKCQ